MAIQVRILKEEVAKDPDVLRKHAPPADANAPEGYFADSWVDAGDVLIVDYEPGHLGPGAAEPVPAPAAEKASKSKGKSGGGKKRGK